MHFLLSALHYIHKKHNIFDVCVTLIKLEYTLCFGFISHACFLCFSNRHVFVLSHILQSSIVYSTLHASTHNTRPFCTHTHTLHKQLWNLGTFRNFPRVLLTHPSESLCVHESCPASSSWAKEALNARGMLQRFGNARKSLGFSPVGCESCHSQRIKSTVRPHMSLSYTKSLPIWQVYVFKGRHLG